MHNPVLLQEAIESLDVKKNGLYIDATFGEGGHSREIIKRGGKVLGIEWDRKQYQISNIKYQKFISKTQSLLLINGNYKDIEKIAKQNSFYPVDGVLFDLGLAMRQLAESGRGFSFKKENEPLDMRVNKQIKTKASDLINNLSKEELYELFAKYSEEVNSFVIAKAIVKARSIKKIETVADLINVIDEAIGRKDEKVYRRIFQALRIATNNEFENLKRGLVGALHLLKKSGRIVVIAFHSLEDRIVKNFANNYELTLISKKPIFSKNNLSFERSAKLRVIGY
ncbi:MAG: 16S rRNA (cytosine(1402)-N(4))-methyltransferase RsmH [Microgenomates group bacterium]